MNFGPETAANGWKFFAHPLNFRIGRHCRYASLTACTLYSNRHGNFRTCYVVARVYSLEQQIEQNAGRA